MKKKKNTQLENSHLLGNTFLVDDPNMTITPSTPTNQHNKYRNEEEKLNNTIDISAFSSFTDDDMEHNQGEPKYIVFSNSSSSPPDLSPIRPLMQL